MRHLLSTSFALALAMTPALGDEIEEALTAALDAYRSGDARYALEELDFARQKILVLQTRELARFLPDPAEGWTREINTEMNASLAMLGGGTGAEAEYTRDGADRFTVTIMADNPMVAAMAGMIGNAAAIGARLERVGRQKFMIQNGEITGLIDSRILVKASGGKEDVMLEALKSMDFKALSDFGR